MKTINSIKQFLNIPIEKRALFYIPESISTKFPIKDNKEGFIELKILAQKNHLPLLVKPSDKNNPKLFMRKTAANLFIKALQNLNKLTKGSKTFKVTDAYRPLDLQKKYFEDIKKEFAEKEGLKGINLWRRVTEFIADPTLCPPHSTGGAIDCTLAYIKNGRELDMGNSLDSIGNESNTFYPNITKKAKQNRLLLFKSLTNVGFANLATEWWHYSYGDQYWAIFYNQSKAIYGSKNSLKK